LFDTKEEIIMIRIFTLITLFASFCASAAEKPVMLFLLGGQSNMDGCGRWEDLTEEMRQTPTNARIWDYKQMVWKKIGEDTTAIARNLQFGPELVFSQRIAKAFPDREIRLVKISAGGTTLAKGWLPDKNKMYPRLIASYRNAVADLEKAGLKVETAGMLWMQGEGDSETIEMANAYEANLGIMLHDLRETTKTPKLPVVMGRISSGLLKSTKWNFQLSPVVQKAQEAVAAKDPDTHIVPTDDLPLLEDNTHFDTKGQITLGERMADAMLKAITSTQSR
jgi:lysophospholipase L1-like esterase